MEDIAYGPSPDSLRRTASTSLRPHSKERQRRACTTCRDRKVKCDGQEPVCIRCQKRGDTCVYSYRKRRSVSSRMTYRDISARLEKMERLVSEFGPQAATSMMTGKDSSSSSPSQSKSDMVSALSLLKMDDGPDFAWTVPRNNIAPDSVDDSNTTAPKDQNGESLYMGSCSLFSQQGARWINTLVGDESFSHVLNCLKSQDARPKPFFDPSQISMNHPLPSKRVILEGFNDFFSGFNQDIRMFQQDQFLNAVRWCLEDLPCPDPASYAAVNLVVAHTIRKLSGMRSTESELYFQNALRMLPQIILQKASRFSVGTLLSMMLYLLFTSRYNASATVLGAITQMMLAAGFDDPKKVNSTDPDIIQERRLLHIAYMFDSDLSLRLGKPPCFKDDVLVDLPPERPEDGHCTVEFEDGSSINFVREQIRLCMIQRKAFSNLRSPQAAAQPLEQLCSVVSQLDEELQNWKDGFPELARPQTPLHRHDESRLMLLTTIHYTYFQLIIAIHSVVIGRASQFSREEWSSNVIPSVALCVGAARASIALLSFHDVGHPYTIHILQQIAWNVDILFINILQNKRKPQAQSDLQLLSTVLRYFEKHDPNYETSAAYLLTRTLFWVSSRAVQNANSSQMQQRQQNLPQQTQQQQHQPSPTPSLFGTMPISPPSVDQTHQQRQQQTNPLSVQPPLPSSSASTQPFSLSSTSTLTTPISPSNGALSSHTQPSTWGPMSWLPASEPSGLTSPLTDNLSALPIAMDQADQQWGMEFSFLPEHWQDHHGQMSMAFAAAAGGAGWLGGGGGRGSGSGSGSGGGAGSGQGVSPESYEYEYDSPEAGQGGGGSGQAAYGEFRGGRAGGAGGVGSGNGPGGTGVDYPMRVGI